MTPPRILTFISLLFAIPAGIHAQDGGQLFTLYCSACHGVDGKGATGGAFPPLAGSPYVDGDARRAIKLVLSGLSGPVEVLGKTYNLEMPPQGAALPDDQIAAILTYVRSSWGNKASAVSPDLVKKVRAETAGRTGPWTAPEILKLHPIKETPPVVDLISRTYRGDWKSIPDFSKLEPTAAEEEPSGKIALPKSPKKGKKAKAANANAKPAGNLGMVWEGVLNLPSDAEYDFHFEADDGGRIFLDGKLLAEITGTGPVQKRGKEMTSRFSVGSHKFRAEYYDVLGQQEIHIAWRKKGEKEWTYLTDESKGGKDWPAIVLSPTASRAVIYRNFISETTTRSIGVGFPGGVNMAYSTDLFAPEFIWTGSFIDAGRHWTNRGQGSEPPAGNHVVKLIGKPAIAGTARHRGYQLDPAGNPTFATDVGDLRILDSYSPAAPAGLLRFLKVTGKTTTEDLTLTEGLSVNPAGTDTFDLAGKLTITAKGAKIAGGNLVLPLMPGTTTEIRYTWK